MTFSLFSFITSAALVDSINPCAFSILFLTIGFLFSLGKSRKHVLVIGLTYIFALYVVYISIGLGILQVLSLFGIPKAISKFGALAIIFSGVIALSNDIWPNFPIKLKMPDFAHGQLAKLIEKATFGVAIVLGLLVGLYEFPCTGGPYLTVLSLLHDKMTYWQGFGYLLWYNFVFVLPLLLALLASSNKYLLEKSQKLRSLIVKKFKYFDGMLMLILGLLIIYFS